MLLQKPVLLAVLMVRLHGPEPDGNVSGVPPAPYIIFSSFLVWWPLNQFSCFQWALGGTSSPWSCPPGPPPAPRVPVGSGASMPGLLILSPDCMVRMRIADESLPAGLMFACPAQGRLPSSVGGQALGHQREHEQNTPVAAGQRQQGRMLPRFEECTSPGGLPTEWEPSAKSRSERMSETEDESGLQTRVKAPMAVAPMLHSGKYEGPSGATA